MNKTISMSIAVPLGIGVALCAPVTGSLIAGAAAVGALKGLAKTPSYGYHRGLEPTNFQISMMWGAIGGAFLSLVMLGTLFCAKACSITPGESLLSSGLFLGAMMICVVSAVCDSMAEEDKRHAAAIALNEQERSDGYRIIQHQKPITVQSECPAQTVTETGIHWFDYETQPVHMLDQMEVSK